MRVEIIFHSEQLTRQLRLVADRVAAGRGRHVARGLIDAARAYMQYIRGRFFRASRGDGTWKDLAPSTKLKRAMKSAPSVIRSATGRGQRAIDAAASLRFPILYDTGRLYRSLSPGGPGYVERFTNPLTIRVGTSVPYATYHQSGTTRMPQRVVLDVPDVRTVKAMERIISEAVEREVKEASQAVGV
jgi:phage gpG-like protein